MLKTAQTRGADKNKDIKWAKLSPVENKKV